MPRLTRGEVLSWGVLALLFIVAGPLFIRMPLCCDVIFYDTTARCLLQGGLLYRDIYIIGSPTIVFFHAAARALFGWSMEALNGVDLLIVSVIVWLLVGKTLPLTSALSRSQRIWVAFILLLFYLSTSEWCHGQPDTWMLLPATAALCLRCRQVCAVVDGAAPKTVLVRSVLEGALWGIAFSIKPFTALAPLACLALTGVLAWRAGRPALTRFALDGCGLLLGGLVIGALLLGWIAASGNWSYFRENARTGPDFQEYYSRTPQWESRVKKVFTRLWPWNLVNLLAMPIALVVLVRSWSSRAAEAARRDARLYPQAMLAAGYLSWFTQANFVQHQFDYHVVSANLLGLTLLASQDWLFRPRWVRFAVLPAVLVWFLVVHPLLHLDRLALWPRCWHKGSDPELRELLGSLDKKNAPFMSSWEDLNKVEMFLRKRQIKDGELTCWSNSSLALYSDLRVKPSNRFVMLASWFTYMPLRRPQIEAEVHRGSHRYIVADLEENLLIPHEEAPKAQRLPTEVFKTYPWNQPIAFRAGRYLVLRASRQAPVTSELPEPPPPEQSPGTASLRTGPALLARLTAVLTLLAITSVGPGLFFVRRFRWNAAETLCASLGLTYILIYLCSFLVYALALPLFVHYAVAAGGLFLTFLSRRDLLRLLRRAEIQSQLKGFAFLLLWGALLLGVIRNFSGGAAAFDWLEHYERSLYFLRIQRNYDFFRVSGSVGSRPPLFNVVAGHYLAQGGTDYPVFQLIELFLSALIYFPLCMMARYFAGRTRYPRFLLLAFLALSPLLWWNTTFTWTKVFTCFYVLLGLWFYLAGWRKGDRRRMIAAFVSMSAAFLVHYSAGPYFLLLSLHYVVCVFPWRHARWRELLAITTTSAALLGTWFLGSLAALGAHQTFASNTTAQTLVNSSPMDSAQRMLTNCIYSVIPHPLRTHPKEFEQAMDLVQTGSAGRLRDHFISLNMGSILPSLGCLGGLLVAGLLIRDLRRLRRSDASLTWFWVVFLTGSSLAGIMVHPYVVTAGVWNICGQSLSYLGLAYLAARFRTLPLLLRVLAAIGCTVDFGLGIILHFSLENYPFRVMRGSDGSRLILRTGIDTLSPWALMNGNDKLIAQANFVGDYLAPLAPLLLWSIVVVFGLIAVRFIMVGFETSKTSTIESLRASP